jgi:hypothetical protein
MQKPETESLPVSCVDREATKKDQPSNLELIPQDESSKIDKLPELEVTPEMINVVCFSYTANGPGQISFEEGEKIVIIQWNYAEGWAHTASLDGKKVGIFPQACIDNKAVI